MSPVIQDFFDVPRECSKVKVQIVYRYVQTWARILSDYLRGQGKSSDVAFADLFSGPGEYSDGTPSTPLLILKAAIEDPKLRSSLRTYFNDINPESVATLQEAISELPGIESLRFTPQVSNREATTALINDLKIPPNIPKLYFLDQFGYKHVTHALIAELLNAWAECIFFFNYRRVIAAIENPVMAHNMDNLFGSRARLEALRTELGVADGGAIDREQIVFKHLVIALKAAGAKHVQPFAFKVEDGQRSTHHLIFLTKSDKGYEIMKGIMANEGTMLPSGIPTLSFTQNLSIGSGDLFPRDEIGDLAADIKGYFKGKTLTVSEMFTQHSPGKPFLPMHYRAATLRLESEGHVTADPAASKRPMKKGLRTMALATRVTFSRGER